MPDQEMRPERLVPKGLPAARRGYDRGAVERLLDRAREAWAALEQEHRRLLGEIERAGGLEYLARDLGTIGSDVGRLLAEAQAAARGLRERARSDSAERLDAALAEARRLVAEAETQSFHLRGGAWAAAEDLLRRAEEAHRAMLAQADAEVLVIRAEAEQEAYRLVSAARREAQEITRGARFEAERTVLELRAQPERIMPVEPAPERPEGPPAAAPARGRRRRHREAVEPAVRGEEGIRLIQPPGVRRPAEGSIDPARYGDALAAEVEALRVSGEVPVVPPEPVPDVDVVVAVPAEAGLPPEETAPEVLAGEVEWEEAAAGEASPEEPAAAALEEPAGPVPGTESAGTGGPAAGPPAVEPDRDEPAAGVAGASEGRLAGAIDDLFSRLRGTTHRPAATPVRREAEEPVAAAASPPPAPARQVDALELRERLLLPVQNRALRRVKEGIVELQNLALDSLRVSGAWDGLSAAAATLQAALDPVGEEAAEAGAAAVGAFLGGEAPAPVIGPRSRALVRAMGGDLAAQVQAAVAGGAGTGPLELAAAVARVFRAWRSEEGERWVRAVAYAAYHDSLLAGLAVAGVKSVTPVACGLLCAECPAARGAAWDPAGSPPRGTSRPPAHPDCVCTVAPG